MAPILGYQLLLTLCRSCLDDHNVNDHISYFMGAAALSYTEDNISQQMPLSSGFYKFCALHSIMYPALTH